MEVILGEHFYSQSNVLKLFYLFDLFKFQFCGDDLALLKLCNIGYGRS